MYVRIINFIFIHEHLRNITYKKGNILIELDTINMKYAHIDKRNVRKC